MINRYKLSQMIRPCSQDETPDWIDLSCPDEEELKQLADSYHLPLWALTEPLDHKEHPRLNQDGSIILIVVRLSFRRQSPEGPLFSTVPVGVIISPDLVVTICREPGLVDIHLSRIFQRKRNWTRARLAFALFYVVGTGFIDNIERLEEKAGAAEAGLRLFPENKELLALLDIEKALIDTTIALKSNYRLMEKFQQPESFGLIFTKEERRLLDDALTENQQAVFMAEIFGEILASMSNAFGSIISNNLNKIMKFLAGVTVVLMLPNLVTSFYGMNVELPGSDLKVLYLILCALCLGLMLAVSILFYKKKWF